MAGTAACSLLFVAPLHCRCVKKGECPPCSLPLLLFHAACIPALWAIQYCAASLALQECQLRQTPSPSRLPPLPSPYTFFVPAPPPCSADVLELHREVVEAAAAYFGARPLGRTLRGDALRTLGALPDGSYDYVIHDVFSGAGAPGQPLMREGFFRRLRAKLAPGGVVAVNYVGSKGQPLKQVRGGPAANVGACS